MRAPLLLAFVSAAAFAAVPQRESPRLFPPEELGMLEGPDRDEWQQPERVMDALDIADGAKVADLGAGGGWFTTRLAHRVGPNGVVYAEDIRREMIQSIKGRVLREGLTNVQTILGTPDDPLLPTGLRAVLIVDTFPQIRDRVGLLRHVARALAANGRLGVVDFKKDIGGGPGPAVEERVEPDAVVRDANQAGLKLRNHETFLRYQYLLVFVK
jgi:ubiquinone/menaquinone biosynthesis C-methylase UbiE